MNSSRLVGTYRREPVELPHHLVDVVQIEDKLQWIPGGEEKGWILTISPEDDSLILLGDDCPYFDDCKHVTMDLEGDTVIGLTFNGVTYMKCDPSFGLVDESYEERRSSRDDDSDGAVVDGEFDFGADDASTD